MDENNLSRFEENIRHQVYERSVRLGQLVPKIVVVKRVAEAAPPPEHVAASAPTPEPAKVLALSVPVVRPYIVHRTYPSVQDILDCVCAFYKVRESEVLSERRSKDMVIPRQIVMLLAKEMTIYSYPKIGRALGTRDHTTVIHGYKRLRERAARDERLRDEIDLIRIKVSELLAARNAAGGWG